MDDARSRLLEAGRHINEGRPADAVLLLDGLEHVVVARVEPVRLRYLAIALRQVGERGRALHAAECALHTAREIGDVDEQVRAAAVLAGLDARGHGRPDAGS